MIIDFLNEKQNSFTLLVIFIVKSLEIEILNNGAVTVTINNSWFGGKWVKSKFTIGGFEIFGSEIVWV